MQAIEDYNRKECVSTVYLHDWLLKLSREHILRMVLVYFEYWLLSTEHLAQK